MYITKQEPKTENKQMGGTLIKLWINNNRMRGALTKYLCIVEACLEGGEVTIFLEVNRQVSLMNWQISPYFFLNIQNPWTKLLDTEVGPIPLWHIHGGKMYRVKLGIFGQTANFGQQPCLFHISNTGIQMNYLSKTLVKLLMWRLIRNRLIWISTICK